MNNQNTPTSKSARENAEERLIRARKRFQEVLTLIEHQPKTSEPIKSETAQKVQEELNILRNENSQLNQMLDRMKADFSNHKMATKKVADQLDDVIGEVTTVLNNKALVSEGG